jgi:two-component system cell cycle sensor histidine kinase/response regulator CckA
MTGLPDAPKAEDFPARLPRGRPWRSALLWLLAALTVASLALAYLFLSSTGGPLPRPPQLARLGDLPDFNAAWILPGGLFFSGLAGVFALGAWLRHRRLLGSYFLLRAFGADPNGRAIAGSDGKLIYWNDAFSRMMQGAPQRRFADLEKLSEHGEGTRQFILLREISHAGGSGHAEICVPGDLGERQWLKISAYALGYRRGYVLWCMEDITSRRQMEQVLTEERAKLIDFLENASIGFYSVDAAGVFEYVNGTLANWLGLTPEEMLDTRRRLANFIAGTGTDPQKPWSPFRMGFEGARGEVTLRRADGSDFQAEIIQALVGDAADGTLRTRTIVRDLTAERELRETLDASEQRFRRLFEEAPTGIGILDLNGSIVDCNKAFRTMCGRERGVIGHALAELLSPANRSAFGLLLSEMAEGKRPHHSLDIGFAYNAEASASLSVTRLDSAGGALAGLIVHLFDTTQNKRLEAQFAQSQKMQAVGQLAGGIAHDFNNLLTVMIGFCDLILQRHRPGEQTFADIMQIKQNANRAANLVRQLLAFSRQQTLQPKVLNVTDVLAELSNLLRRLIGVNINLEVIHSRDLGLVRVDQVQFEQVIINLAVNARDAMKEKGGGTLTLRTSNVDVAKPVRRGADVMPPGRYVKIEMSDTGTGISPDNIERIFEPFFSTKEVGQGTGLGLSTVYGIVTQTGGFVQVDSSMGKGTTFSIFLPRFDEAPAAKAERGAEPAAKPRRAAQDLSGVGTVLLVEDEDPVRMFGSRALRNKGYKVLEAKNGDAALEVMRDSPDPIDLIISDVVMPQRDGPTLIREVREKFPEMKVIFISGYAEDDFRESLASQPGIHFLAKPFSLDQLAGKVKDVLAE